MDDQVEHPVAEDEKANDDTGPAIAEGEGSDCGSQTGPDQCHRQAMGPSDRSGTHHDKALAEVSMRDPVLLKADGQECECQEIKGLGCQYQY